MFVLAEGQFVDAAHVHDLAHIDVAKSIIGSDAEAGNVGCPIAADTVVQHIARVAQALGVGVVGEQAKALGEAALHVELNAVVVGSRCPRDKRAVGGETRKEGVGVGLALGGRMVLTVFEGSPACRCLALAPT